MRVCHDRAMPNTQKQVSITFAIPSDWDADSFIMEMAEAYADANPSAAELVEYVVGSVIEVAI